MKMRYIMRGFTSVGSTAAIFNSSFYVLVAAAQEQPENNQFNGLELYLAKARQK